VVTIEKRRSGVPVGVTLNSGGNLKLVFPIKQTLFKELNILVFREAFRMEGWFGIGFRSFEFGHHAMDSASR
jgi:hypothetical protein